MLDSIIDYVLAFENVLWGYFGVPTVIFLGIFLTIQSRGAQFRNLPTAVKTFISFLKKDPVSDRGISPLKAFFACIGGSVGVGNVVGVCTAIQIGGPGALFWIWMTAIAGSLVKYSEVYLGVKYRIDNGNGGYNGGPMFFLRRALDRPWVPALVCILLCVYGVEIFQFGVVTKTIATNWGWDLTTVAFSLLALVLFAGSGGVSRVGSIASALIPVFVVTYISMGAWVLFQNLDQLPTVFGLVISSAFSEHAAIGGFIGSGMMATVSHGVRRGCYSGDIGIGYASVLHSESSVQVPEKQALLVIFEIFMDTFLICTTSVMITLITGTWHQVNDATQVVQSALAQYFPYMNFFMPLFLFLVGYATINAYFCVGLKCAAQLMPVYGKRIYYAYASISLIFFSYFDTTLAQAIMAIAGGFLLLINSVGIFLLRKELSFDLKPENDAVEKPEELLEPAKSPS